MNIPDEIIVFKKFDNSIEANIIRTKLEAHNIPCFLTEENLANLYPGQNYMMFTVRLHLFAKDEELARSILNEGNMVVNDDVTKCPQCQSSNVIRGFPKILSEKFSSALSILFFGIFFPKQKVYHCLECEQEFDIA